MAAITKNINFVKWQKLVNFKSESAENCILTCLICQIENGAIVVVIVWYLELQLPMQSLSNTTKVVSSNPVHGEVYSIQHYVIKFISGLRQVSGFSPGMPVSSTNKTDSHDITEILLKVV